MTQNQWGPVYTTTKGLVNSPVNPNVNQTNPAPPPFNAEYDVLSTEAYWLTQQGILVPSAPRFLNTYTTVFYLGQQNIFVVVAVGNPVPVLSCSTLPSGLIFTNNGNGQATLAGIPTVAAGTYSLIFTATNGDVFGPSTSFPFTLTIQPKL